MAVTEGEVGIRAWTNDLPGFTGIIKQRYSDFRVNEVTVHGEVVQLTDTQSIKRAQQHASPAAAAAAVPAAEDAPDPNAGYPQEGVDAALADFAELAGDANAALLRDYVAAVLGRTQTAATTSGSKAEPPAAHGATAGGDAGGTAQDATAGANGATEAPLFPREAALTGGQSGAAAVAPDAADGRATVAADSRGVSSGIDGAAATSSRGRPPRHLLLQPILEKAKRGAVHGFFKRELRLPPMRTETSQSTDREGGSTAPSQGLIQVTAQKGKRKRGSGDSSADGGGGREDWPGGANRYCRFVLRKENMDTQAALSLLARMLHCSPGVFGFAGTKDKRAVTEQAVTAFKVPDTRLASLNRGLRGLQLGNFSYVEEPLGLGAAGGNQFDIVLRGVTDASPEQVVAAVEGLARDGFVNYFGLQRFGSGMSATHKVGALLLKGQWEAAARLILAGPKADRPDIAAARAAFLEKGDVKAALRGLPKFLTAERAILGALQRNGGNAWLQALEAIPRNLRSMYVHAYQSYLWNMATSHRIEQHGAGAVIAGDLVLPPTAAAAGESTLDEDAMEEAAPDAEGREAGGMRAAGRLAAVHVVTAEEAAAGTYDVADVVLPLPGSRVRYPEHDTAQVYQQLAAQDGVPLDASPHGCRPFSITCLAGDYRRLVQRPSRVAWRLLRYGAPDVDLATVPPEGAPGVSVEAVSANFGSAGGSNDGTSAAAATGAAPAAEAGSLLALQLRFQLPTSVYATMAIRQATKANTATAEHRTATLAALAKAKSEASTNSN